MEKGIRTCISCRQKFNKFETEHIKISYDNSILINSANSIGKSCYIHNTYECIDRAVKQKLLNKRFKKNISNEDYLLLKNIKG